MNGKLILIQFEDCTVTYKDEVLFKPEYGTFDLAIGSSIISAYAGSADFRSFDDLYRVSKTKTVKIKKDSKTLALEHLYQQIRDMRSNDEIDWDKVRTLFKTLRENHPNDWLLSVELYELAKTSNEQEFISSLVSHLNLVKQSNPQLGPLIDDGMALIDERAVR